jgi:hypothetical protein
MDRTPLDSRDSEGETGAARLCRRTPSLAPHAFYRTIYGETERLDLHGVFGQR